CSSRQSWKRELIFRKQIAIDICQRRPVHLGAVDDWSGFQIRLQVSFDVNMGGGEVRARKRVRKPSPHRMGFELDRLIAANEDRGTAGPEPQDMRERLYERSFDAGGRAPGNAKSAVLEMVTQKLEVLEGVQIPGERAGWTQRISLDDIVFALALQNERASIRKGMADSRITQERTETWVQFELVERAQRVKLRL